MSIVVPASAVVPYLPDGFAPKSLGPDSASGTLGVEAFTCQGGSGLNATMAPLTYGSVWAFVTPPTNRHVPSSTQAYVKWDTLVPDAPRRILLQNAGFPVHDGTATVVAAAQVQASLVMDGQTYTITGVAKAPTNAPAADFIEYTPTPTGLGSWSANTPSSNDQIGIATVTLPAGSIAAKILGSTTAVGALDVGTWTFQNGTIKLHEAQS